MAKKLKTVNGQPCIVLNDCRCYEKDKQITVDLKGLPMKFMMEFEFNYETGEWEEVPAD